MRIVFIGTGAIGVPVLRSLLDRSSGHELVGIVTQPDKPAGRTQRVSATPIKAAAHGADIPIYQPERIKRDEAVGQLRELAPDVIVVMAYGQILPRAVLDIPPVACLNLHASLLPRHRGAAPIQAAILAGDSETGITVMYMDEGLDTGDTFLESRLPISPQETGGSLHDRLGEIAPDALAQALQMLAAGTAPRVPQDHAHATYAPKLEREHGRIDWSETSEVIERKVRAFNPWPGAFVTLRDGDGHVHRMKLFQVTNAVDDESARLTFRVADGVIAVNEAQLEGKRRMSADELLRGQPWIAHAAAEQRRSL